MFLALFPLSNLYLGRAFVGTWQLHVTNLPSYIVLKHYLKICLHHLWGSILDTSIYTSRPRLEQESEISRSQVRRFGTVPSRSVKITDFSVESR